MNPYKYFILLIIPAIAVGGYLAGGYYTFLTPVCCFILLPLLELVSSNKEPFESHVRATNDRAFRFIPYVFVPVVLLLAFGGSMTAASKSLSAIEFFGMMLSVGVVSGTIGFALAHEFIHKHTAIEKVAGHLLLMSSLYMHYSIEHVHGHHVYACTLRDPNSARKGESFYAFFARSIPGSYQNAWKIESKRLAKHRLSFFSVHNRMLVFLLIQLGMVSVLTLAFGTKSLLFFSGQSFIAILLHQQANYIQHYGLIRNTGDAGCEKMHAHHTWSIPRPCRIVDLFQVENHADHHIHASTPYERLTAMDDSPKLPANYATMMVVSLIPPLWFKLIHSRLPSYCKPSDLHASLRDMPNQSMLST